MEPLEAGAGSLDVREIFARISAEARRIVPLDFDVPETPGNVAVPLPLRLAIEEEAFVLSDVRIGAGRSTITGLLRLAGDEPHVRSNTSPSCSSTGWSPPRPAYMRVAVRLRGGVLGGLIFCSTASVAANIFVTRCSI